MKRFFSVITVIALVFIMTIPAFASSVDIPPLPAGGVGVSSTADLITKDSQSIIWLHRLEGIRIPVRYESSYNSSGSIRYTGVGDDTVQLTVYKLDPVTNEWTRTGSNTYSNASSVVVTVSKKEDTLYTNIDIYDSSGDPFFTCPTAPLWAEVLAEVKTALRGETQGIMTQGWILILCGAGCLALLIAVPLLLKILRIFRV